MQNEKSHEEALFVREWLCVQSHSFLRYPRKLRPSIQFLPDGHVLLIERYQVVDLARFAFGMQRVNGESETAHNAGGQFCFHYRYDGVARLIPELGETGE